MVVVSIIEKVLKWGVMFGIIKRKCYLCREITKYNNEQLAMPAD